MNQTDLDDKLAKVLGMIGSAHDGEALSAAQTATRMLRSNGLTWREFIDAHRDARDAAALIELKNAEIANLLAEIAEYEARDKAVTKIMDHLRADIAAMKAEIVEAGKARTALEAENTAQKALRTENIALKAELDALRNPNPINNPSEPTTDQQPSLAADWWRTMERREARRAAADIEKSSVVYLNSKGEPTDSMGRTPSWMGTPSTTKPPEQNGGKGLFNDFTTRFNGLKTHFKS